MTHLLSSALEVWIERGQSKDQKREEMKKRSEAEGVWLVIERFKSQRRTFELSGCTVDSKESSPPFKAVKHKRERNQSKYLDRKGSTQALLEAPPRSLAPSHSFFFFFRK